MKTSVVIPLLVCLGMPLASMADTATVDGLIENYASQGADKPDAQRGEKMWNQKFPGEGGFTTRSCASCHTQDLTATGKHVRTGKPIKPMAPAVNPERLTSSKDVEKWFLRNCKWTLGRECTPQEKADLLLYISNYSRF